LFVDASGRVGIGTESITAGNKLQVNVDADGDYAIYGISPGASGLVGLNPDGTNGNILRYGGVGSNSGVLRFVQGVSTERMRLDSSGRLGLGTSSPSNTAGFSQQLEVAGNLPCVSISNTGTGANKYSLGVNGVGALGFWDNTASAFRMYINSSGSVGIGTTSPGNLLELKQNTPAFRQTSVSESGGYVSTFGLGYSTTSTFIIEANATGGPVRRILNFGEQGSLELDYLSGSSSRAFIIKDGSTERARIDSSGRLLVGTSTARTNVNGYQPLFQVETAASDDALNRYASFTYGRNSGGGGFGLAFNRHASTTVGGQAAVANDYVLGQLDFNGSDGTNFIPGARISASVDGTPSANDMPSRLVFSTTADGASSPTERMRITSTGQLRLAGAGITFNGDTAAANELDDYEEGTWTPTIAFGGGSTGITYFTQSAVYTKVGNRVTLSGLINLTSKGSSTGSATITGLPFTSGSSAGDRAAGSIDFISITYAGQVATHINSSATEIVLSQITEAGVNSTLANTNFTNDSVIWFSLSYKVS
jgi:hypothetical protein